MIVETTFTKDGGKPATGLLPTITIMNSSDSSVIVNQVVMSEIGNGGYKFDFTDFDESIDYFIVCDAQDRSLDGKGYSYGHNELFKKEFIDKIAQTVLNEISNVYGGYGL